MASAVGSLFIDLAMNTAAFASDLGKAQTQLSSWAASSNRVLAGVVNSFREVSKEMGVMTEEVFSLKGAMLTLIGGGIIGEFIKKNLESATALVHQSEAMGISTDALQEYQFAAKLSGVSQETLNGAIEKFGKNLGQLQAGTGSLFSYLQKSNPALLEQLQHVHSVDDGVNLLFQSMSKLDNQQSRLALSAAAFSKGGLEMVNMADRFDELKQKALELGIVIDNSLLRGAHNAQEQLEILGTVIKAKLMVAVIQNSDAIAKFAKALIDAMPAIAAFGTAILNIATYFLSFGRNLDMAREDLMKIGATAQIAAMEVSSIFKGGATQQDIADFARRADTEIKALDTKIQAMNNIQPVKLPEEAQKGIPGTAAANIKAAHDLAEATKEADAEQQRLMDDADKTYTAMLTPLEKYYDRMDDLNEELRQGYLDQTTYNRAVEQAGEAYKTAQDKGQLWTDLMGKSIHGQIKSWQDLGKAVLNYAQDLLTALATGQGSMGKNLFSTGGGIGNLFGSFFGGGGSGSGSFNEGLDMLAPEYHGGGTVGGGGGLRRSVSSSVFAGARRMHSGGLAGDEVPAILQKGEQVVPAGQRKGGGNNGIVIQYLDARGADSGVEQRLRMAIQSLSDTIEQRSINAVRDASFRNPTLLGGRA